MVTISFSGLLAHPEMLGPKALINATRVQSASHFSKLLKTYEEHYFYPKSDNVFPEASVGDADRAANRDYIKTNIQVEGVDEADIIKTDGYQIYYASRYQNEIRIITIGDDYKATVEKSLSLGNVYTDSIYLTEQYIIVVGYMYESFPRLHTETDYYHFGFISQTGAICVYDRDSLERVYRLDTSISFYEHRLYGNQEDGYALYLVGNQYTYGDDPRPIYTTYENDQKETSILPYENIYYMPGTPIQGMTVITGIDLDDFSEHTEAYLGGMSLIYASNEAIYVTQNVYDYTLFSDKSYTQIWKFSLRIEDALVRYVGSGKVEGYINDSYWLDEYDGHLRVVTSKSNPISNSLFILKESQTQDSLDMVGSITKGLGKIDETVKSVRFNKQYGYVVTFRQMDPLYTIDLSNPKKPVIVSEIEEPGFSTYLHLWDDQGHAIEIGRASCRERV